MKVKDDAANLIGYRLNILGIRVRNDCCQLVAKTQEGWTTIGPLRKLPVRIPQTAEDLKTASSDPLLLTAFQYNAEFPASDIRDVLAGKKTFQDSLAGASTVPDALLVD